MKKLLSILLIFLLVGCSVDEKPIKEYEACLSLKSSMIKGYKSMKKIGIKDSSGFYLCCFNYNYNETHDIFKVSERGIDIPDILDFYKKIDNYCFRNKDISDLRDTNFKINYISSTDIDNFKTDVYSIRTKMDLISTVYVHNTYGIVLVESEYPSGIIELLKFKNKKIKLRIPSFWEIDSNFEGS